MSYTNICTCTYIHTFFEIDTLLPLRDPRMLAVFALALYVFEAKFAFNGLRNILVQTTVPASMLLLFWS